MNETCSICLQPISPELKCQTNCNHEFCKGCLDLWFDSKKVTCPLCREYIQYFKHNDNINRVVCIEKKEPLMLQPLPINPIVTVYRRTYLCLLITSCVSSTLLIFSSYLLISCDKFSY